MLAAGLLVALTSPVVASAQAGEAPPSTGPSPSDTPPAEAPTPAEASGPAETPATVEAAAPAEVPAPVGAPAPVDAPLPSAAPSLALAEARAVQVGGFADVGVLGTDNLREVGFQIGQLVVHGTADAGHGLAFFTEVSVNSTPTWETRVERLLLSWEQSDFFKVSLGRHHLPVTWWNSTFHHGLWLQTSAARPLIIGYSDAFVPNHAVGLILEGFVPGAQGAGLRYHVALSGGGDDHRHTVESATEPRRLAGTAAFSVEPPGVPLLRLGVVAYADPHRMRGDEMVAETILGAHVASTRERPELLVEWVEVLHDAGPSRMYRSNGAYAQAAWRLRAAGERFKPYARHDRMRIAVADPTLADRVSQDLTTVGLRVDVSTRFAVKTEGAWRVMAGGPGAAEAAVQVSTAW